MYGSHIINLFPFWQGIKKNVSLWKSIKISTPLYFELRFLLCTHIQVFFLSFPVFVYNIEIWLADSSLKFIWCSRDQVYSLQFTWSVALLHRSPRGPDRIALESSCFCEHWIIAFDAADESKFNWTRKLYHNISTKIRYPNQIKLRQSQEIGSNAQLSDWTDYSIRSPLPSSFAAINRLIRQANFWDCF